MNWDYHLPLMVLFGTATAILTVFVIGTLRIRRLRARQLCELCGQSPPVTGERYCAACDGDAPMSVWRD